MKDLKTLIIALALLLASSLIVRGFVYADQNLPCKLGLAKCEGPPGPEESADDPTTESMDIASLVNDLPVSTPNLIEFDSQFRLELDQIKSACQVFTRLLQLREKAHEAARKQGVQAPLLDNDSVDLLSLVPSTPDVAPRLVLMREGRTLRMRVKGCRDQLQALRLIKRAIQTEVAIMAKHYVENCAWKSQAGVQLTPTVKGVAPEFLAKVALFAKTQRSEDALEVYKDVERWLRKEESDSPSVEALAARPKAD